MKHTVVMREIHRDREDRLNAILQSVYSSTLKEETPERFMKLLDRMG